MHLFLNAFVPDQTGPSHLELYCLYMSFCQKLCCIIFRTLNIVSKRNIFHNTDNIATKACICSVETTGLLHLVMPQSCQSMYHPSKIYTLWQFCQILHCACSTTRTLCDSACRQSVLDGGFTPMLEGAFWTDVVQMRILHEAQTLIKMVLTEQQK